MDKIKDKGKILVRVVEKNSSKELRKPLRDFIFTCERKQN